MLALKTVSARLLVILSRYFKSHIDSPIYEGYTVPNVESQVYRQMC